MRDQFLVMSASFLSVVLVSISATPAAAADRPSGELVKYGTMHDAIGMQHDEGRVLLSELVSRPHFYAVGALAGLAGEVTIYDSAVIVTQKNAQGQLAANDDIDGLQATMLAGASVPAWAEHEVVAPVEANDFDQFIADRAAAAGMDVGRPFLFVVEGDFTDVAMHVIHGACPLHARLKKTELPADQQPYEGEFQEIRGALVGIYAKGAVGKLTHPATSTHVHIVYNNNDILLTGHVERVGLSTGCVLKLPEQSHGE